MGILQDLFSSKPSALVGVDISSSSVKLLELRRQGNGYGVESYAAEPLPDGSVADKRISDPEKVGACIKRVVKKARTSTQTAAVSVSGSSVITKVINMPAAMGEEEMEEQIKLQSDQYIPYPADEVNLDFQVLGRNDGSDDICDVLLAACRTETVDERIAAVEVAGLTPWIVDIDDHARENAASLLTRQMPLNGENQTIAIVDMGATATTLQILHNLKTVYTREQSFGGQSLIEEIAQNHGMSTEEALRAQRQGEMPEDYDQYLQNFINDMVLQIENSLQFFFSSKTEYDTIDQILLTGGCANIPDMDQAVSERVGVPSTVAEPFSGMRMATRVRASLNQNDTSSLLVACGLALRAFD